MTTSEINGQRLDIFSGPGTTALVATVRERLRVIDRRRIIAIGRSVQGSGFVVTAPTQPASDPAVAKWVADGAPTCDSRWAGNYSGIEPAENRPGYIGD